MHYTLSLSKFLGINEANISIDGITLITGENGAGKSSILRAAAACATSSVVPVMDDGKELVKKGETKTLVHGSEKKATATLADCQGNATTMVWPTNGIKKDGAGFPVTHKLGAGLVDWQDIGFPERSFAIVSATGDIEPTKDELMLSCPKIESALIERVWCLIVSQGWSNAFNEISKEWTEQKGGWRAITEEMYGEQKAKDWLPKGWSDALKNESEASLQQKVKEAEVALEDGVSRQAVDQVKLQQLRDIAGRQPPSIDGIDSHITQIQQSITEMEQAWKSESAQIRQPLPLPTIPKETNQNGQCPQCQTGLFVQGSRIEVATVTTSAILARAKKETAAIVLQNKEIDQQNTVHRLKMDELRLTAAKARQTMGMLEAEKKQALQQIEAIKKAQQQLEAMTKVDGGMTQGQIANLRQQLEVARKNFVAFITLQKATAIHELIMAIGTMRDVLAPEGLRKKKMAEVIASINSELRDIASYANWPVVRLDENLNMSMGNHPYPLLSKSEQFRCQVIMQAWLAYNTKASIIMIDGADILDASGRFGLIEMLKELQIPALVAMTAKKEYAQLVAQYFDQAYWVEHGTAVQVAAMALEEMAA